MGSESYFPESARTARPAHRAQTQDIPCSIAQAIKSREINAYNTQASHLDELEGVQRDNVRMAGDKGVDLGLALPSRDNVSE